MHPLAAIGLVFLMGLSWTVTVLTVLIAQSLRPPADISRADEAVASRTADDEAA